MSGTLETGHARNVANFELLINYCIGYGAAYNPSISNIMFTTLGPLLLSSKDGLLHVATAKSTHDHITNLREIGFKPLSKLCTRVINALEACGASKGKLQDARGILNKIQGRRKKKIETSSLPEAPHHISVSHRSFDSRFVHFQSLIQLLLTEPKYYPNETELSIAGLSSKLDTLEASNHQVRQSAIQLSNARVQRDTIFYISENSLCETARDIKKYIKSAFGTTSAQYKQISKIRFPLMATTV